MVPPYGYISRKIDVLQPYSHSVLTSVSCARSPRERLFQIYRIYEIVFR